MCPAALCMYVCIHTYIYTQIHTYISSYIHTYLPTYLPTYPRTHPRTHAPRCLELGADILGFGDARQLDDHAVVEIPPLQA